MSPGGDADDRSMWDRMRAGDPYRADDPRIAAEQVAAQEMAIDDATTAEPGADRAGARPLTGPATA